MVSSKTPKQSNYQDTLGYNLNIKSVFDTFITVIDQIRSKVNISANQTKLNKLDKNTINTIASLVKPESTPQESRYHAFLRWVGFPVISFDKSRWYNPGHDIIKTPNRKITLDYKLAVANAIDDENSQFKFRDLSLIRENYINKFLKHFANGQSVDAGVLSLLSGRFIRSFSSPFDKESDPFDCSPQSQQYIILKNTIVGDKSTTLDLYVDINGNTPSSSALTTLAGQAHIIKPFMVDPRIDFSVSPSYNRVAVPFVPDNTYLRVAEGQSAHRPLIEKVLRERFSNNNPNSKAGTIELAFNDYVLKNPGIENQSLLDKVKKSTTFSLAEQDQFLYFLNLIKSMMKELVNAQLIIEKVQSKYYWLPIPSATGPEGGCKSNPIFISQKIVDEHKELLTDMDQEIIISTISVAKNSFTQQANEAATGTPDVPDISLPGFTTTFGPDTSPAFEDNAKKNLDVLSAERDKALSRANAALQTIEIIMGEYSGLGLCDIIAIMGALYITDKSVLLNFLDSDALTRMDQAMGWVPAPTGFAGAFASTTTASATLDSAEGQRTKSISADTTDIESAMIVFAENVRDFYFVMDKIYLDTRKNNNL